MLVVETSLGSIQGRGGGRLISKWIHVRNFCEEIQLGPSILYGIQYILDTPYNNLQWSHHSNPPWLLSKPYVV